MQLKNLTETLQLAMMFCVDNSWIEMSLFVFPSCFVICISGFFWQDHDVMTRAVLY